MNISAEAITDNRSVTSILAWPRHGKPFAVNEDQVREKVAATLEAELARDDLSVSLIVDKLIGRQNGAVDCGVRNNCACAA